MECAAFFEAVNDRLGDRYEEPSETVVGAPDGEMVTVLHYSVRTGPVSVADLEATLDAVADALVI